TKISNDEAVDARARPAGGPESWTAKPTDGGVGAGDIVIAVGYFVPVRIDELENRIQGRGSEIRVVFRVDRSDYGAAIGTIEGPHVSEGLLSARQAPDVGDMVASVSWSRWPRICPAREQASEQKHHCELPDAEKRLLHG